MFLSQIEKKMPGTTTGVVEPKPKRAPAARAVREWKPRIVQRTEMPDPLIEPEVYAAEVRIDHGKPPFPEEVPELPPLDIVDDRKKTRTCGIELPLDVHAVIVAEAKRRKVAYKKVALEYILAEHNRRQMR